MTIDSLPGGLLNHIEIAPTDDTVISRTKSSAIHYLDLGGILAGCLLDFGGTDEFWAGINKLYASNCGLQRIKGIAKLRDCRYLYLDNSNLPKEELLKLATELSASLHRKLVTLDLSNNPGWDEEVEIALLATPLFAFEEGTCYLNGKKIQQR